MLRLIRKKAQSTIEFMVLLLFILTSFFVFQKYIVRGITGRYKSVGDGLGQGRIYDPNLSQECSHGGPYGVGAWFDRDCFDRDCEDDCLRVTATQAACTACITSCFSAQCNDL